MNKVAVVIPNWNGEDVIRDCLSSLLKQEYEHTVVVVDNGSVDSSVEIIESEFPNAILLKQPKNLGFAGGVNVGIRYAIKEKYDFVALLNNDAAADKDWLRLLLVEMKKKSVGIVTGLLLDQKGILVDTTGELYSKWGLAFPRGRGEAVSNAPSRSLVFGASGGASLYRTAIFKEIGMFDQDLFAYYEDTDVSFRTQLAGWKVLYTPEAIAYHKHGVTSKKIPGFTTYQTFKNLPLLFLKNVPGRLLFTIGIRFYFAYLLMLLHAVVRSNGAPALKGALRGFVLGFKKLSERWKIQRNKRVSTEYIKSILWNDLPPDQTGLRKLRKFFTGK